MIRTLRRLSPFILIILLIEFLDEFVYGAREAAWPLVRGDLGLSYAQVGVLLGVPNVIGNVIEPVLGILGDVWRRRVLVLGGGVLFATALLLTALSRDFGALLAAFIIFYPASGAFVGLSQATLMDADPTRHEQNMARWTFAGSLGVVAGSLALSAAVALGPGWRGLNLFFATLTIALLTLGQQGRAWGQTPPDAPDQYGREGQDAAAATPASAPTRQTAARARFSLAPLRAGLRGALLALRRGVVLRWLVLLEFSDLMMDVLLGYLALYFVDVVGATPGQAGLAVAVWTGVGLLGDLLLIPLLERMRGLRYLRASVLAELLLFPAFLLAPGMWAKLILVGLLGLFNSGWYAILQAGLYSALPGQSGTALAVKNVSGIAGSLIPLALGLAAERLGLAAAMWLLLLGPIVLLIGLPVGTPES